MKDFIRINGNICRLTIPYKDIFTTLYTVTTPEGAVLFDAASTDEDIRTYLPPLLAAAGILPEALRYVFISHHHKDHSGGLAELVKLFPHIRILSRSPQLAELYGADRLHSPEDEEKILGCLRSITIPGHTADSMALLDERTRTLITGDSLQQFGIFGSSDWGAAISLPTEHFAALEKVRKLGADQILAAHEYHPCGYRADSREAGERMLDACIEPLLRLRALIADHPELDDVQIRQAYLDTDRVPPIHVRVVAAMRRTLETGSET